MKELIFRGPVNSLSFGNVSLNILRELYKKKINVAIFPIGDDIQLTAYDKIDPDFKEWIISSAKNRFNLVNKDIPTLTQWHLNGSEMRVSSKQYLFTFYEVDQPTIVEKSLVDLQDHVIFSSTHAEDKFKFMGCKNISSAPCGFDTDFHLTGKEYLKNKIHFGLMGKFEKRKNTGKIIRAWAKKYGNNYDYQLSCCITNPFFKPEQMNQIIGQVLEGKTYGNINFLPYLSTNSEVNEFINAIDIDLTGLSGAEGWNLPAFNSTCLGKWSIVLNCTSHKDWADKDNCILVEPEGLEPIYDGTFFHEGSPFNQGNMCSISEEKILESFEKSESFAGKNNTKGVKLSKEFTYEKTLNKILETIYE